MNRGSAFWQRKPKNIPTCVPNNRSAADFNESAAHSDGRGDRTRTCGILVPNQALYQTELRLVVDVAHGGEKSPATEKFQALCALSFIDVSVKHLSASSDSLIIILPNACFVNRFFITLYTCTITPRLKAIQISLFNKLYRDIIRKHQK